MPPSVWDYRCEPPHLAFKFKIVSWSYYRSTELWELQEGTDGSGDGRSWRRKQ
jgi:hypothetical protein